jgi:hypothetical protein
VDRLPVERVGLVKDCLDGLPGGLTHVLLRAPYRVILEHLGLYRVNGHLYMADETDGAADGLLCPWAEFLCEQPASGLPLVRRNGESVFQMRITGAREAVLVSLEDGKESTTAS